MACYVHSSLHFKRLHVERPVDIVAIDIRPLRVIGVYRGFKLPQWLSKNQYLDLILKNLKKLTKTDRTLLIGGDFNADWTKNGLETLKLQNWAINSGLQQLVRQFTRRRVVTKSLDGHQYIEQSEIRKDCIKTLSVAKITRISR